MKELLHLSFWIVMIFLVYFTHGAGAAEPLSLNDAVGEALKESPVVEESEAHLREAKWKHIGTRAGLFPKVDLFATHSFDTEYENFPFTAGPISASVPIAMPHTAYGLQMSWMLFDGLANWNGAAASSFRQDSATSAYDRKRFEVKKKIELQYYAVLEAIQMSEVANQNLKTIDDSLGISRARLRNGVSTAPDVLRVQVQQTEAQAEVQRTSDVIVIQREKLRQAMGLGQDDRPLNGELPRPGAKDLVKALSFQGVADRDDIQALEKEESAAEREHAASVGSLLPAVALTGHIENYDNTDYRLSGHDGSFRRAYDIGLALKWRILDGGETPARLGVAAARRDEARSEWRQATISAPTDFELWKRRYVYSADLYEARVRDIKRAEESLRIIKLSFEQGRRIINEVLDAETDLFRSRAGAVQSQFEAAEALNQLELVIGKDLL